MDVISRRVAARNVQRASGDLSFIKIRGGVIG